jgi:Fe-S cluster biogenesis protein NfuA
MSTEAVSLGIEEQVRELESVADPHARALALKLVASVLKLHSTGIERMLRIINEVGSGSESILAEFQRDPLVRALLILHDLNEQTPELRVEQALQELEPQLEKLGAKATVLHLDAQSVRISIRGGDQGCGSTVETVRSLVEKKIIEASPDMSEIEIRMESPPPVLIPISAIAPSPQRDDIPINSSRRK